MLSWACTHTRSGGAGAKHLQRLAQLAGLRPVLGVVHHHELAARELQRVVQGLRLGLRRQGRHDDGAKIARQVDRQQRRLRLAYRRSPGSAGRRAWPPDSPAHAATAPARPARCPRAAAAPAPSRPAASDRRGAPHRDRGARAAAPEPATICRSATRRSSVTHRNGSAISPVNAAMVAAGTTNTAADGHADRARRSRDLPCRGAPAGRVGRPLAQQAAHGLVDAIAPAMHLADGVDGRLRRQHHLMAAAAQHGDAPAEVGGGGAGRAQHAAGAASHDGGQAELRLGPVHGGAVAVDDRGPRMRLRRPAPARERSGVVGLADPARCDQHGMRGNAGLPGFALGPVEGGAGRGACRPGTRTHAGCDRGIGAPANPLCDAAYPG